MMLKQRLKTLVARLLKSTLVLYVIGGGGAAVLHLLIVAGLVELANYDKEVANSIGFVVGVVVNYTYQCLVTFRHSGGDHWQKFPLFLGFAVIGLGINRFVFSHSVNDAHLQYLVATAFAIVVVFMFNFTANRLVTFRETKEDESSDSIDLDDLDYAQAQTFRSSTPAANNEIHDVEKQKAYTTT